MITIANTQEQETSFLSGVGICCAAQDVAVGTGRDSARIDERQTPCGRQEGGRVKDEYLLRTRIEGADTGHPFDRGPRHCLDAHLNFFAGAPDECMTLTEL